jgi:serine/threonine protein kinase
MGEVYRCRDPRLGREVAIKVLPSDRAADPQRLARFQSEARAVSALNHPNIVTVHEVGTAGTGPYLVMELVDGESLRAALDAGPLAIRRVAGIGAQVAAGLAKAHAAGVVHRDLKPENVMVTRDGFAKVLDFGIARLLWPDEDHGASADTATFVKNTETGVILGTLGYLSPEQAAGKPADDRSDQFALGALLYEMATGVRPFKRATALESLAATAQAEAEPVRSKRPDHRSLPLEKPGGSLRVDQGSGARSGGRPRPLVGDPGGRRDRRRNAGPRRRSQTRRADRGRCGAGRSPVSRRPGVDGPSAGCA